jgi:3-deoxy-manno-octulosonate cytidylyltransferase (CMP-KDO synthetase)
LTGRAPGVTFSGVNFASGRAPSHPLGQVRQQRILGVIPARLASERLPRKPLHLLAGRPLVEWVWRRVSSFQLLDRVVVATDAREIMDLCASAGAEAVLTDAAHGSGTERIAEVVAMQEYGGYDIVVNVQGDEPLVSEEQVTAAVAQVRRGFDIGTVAAPVGTLEAWRDPAVVKVVRGVDGGALYFSRSAIPHLRDGQPTAEALCDGSYLRHVGIYAYPPGVLLEWVRLERTPLEQIEKLEQLRALAAGLRIGVGVVAHAEGGVDTAADAARAEDALSRGQHT